MKKLPERSLINSGLLMTAGDIILIFRGKPQNKSTNSMMEKRLHQVYRFADKQDLYLLSSNSHLTCKLFAIRVAAERTLKKTVMKTIHLLLICLFISISSCSQTKSKAKMVN